MSKTSAGLLMYRIREGDLEVFLVHPGGPYWRNKDDGAWTIPKGEVEPGEDYLEAAMREFQEETGVAPTEPFWPPSATVQKAGKTVWAWAFEGNLNPSELRSNTFELEWPPRSGRRQEFPEVDRADFFGLSEAHEKILPGQRPLLAELELAWKKLNSEDRRS